jgi:non-specific serine/threonine protein kinase
MRAAAAALIAAVAVAAALLLADGSPAGTDRWRALPSAPSKRGEVAAARVGGSIYVAGGFTPDGRTTSAVERYDIERRRWRRVPALPVALNHPVAVAHRGRLYVSGGYASPNGLAEPSRVLLRYTPRTRRWRRMPSAPTPRAAHAAAVIRGRLYLAGGANDTGSLSSLEIYDFARRRWSSGPSFPGPARNHTTGVASGGLFYVIAGRDSANYTDVDRYDPRRRRWERLPDLRTPRGGIASARLRDGRIVVFGGENLAPGGRTIPEVELFNPRTSRWRSLPDLRTPRHGLGGASLGNRVYALAGGVVPGLSTSSAIEFLDVRPLRR